EADRQSGAPTGWRLGYSGSTLFMRRQFMLSRSLTSSFAVVNTSGTGGIPVLANRQYIAKTNGHGLALVPNLSPYNPNLLALGEDTPDGLDVEFAEKSVVPMPRSGVFVDFKAKRITAALLKLVTEDGAEIPVGAIATINGNMYTVVLHGELYVPDIVFPASLHVEWEDHVCDAVVSSSAESSKVMPHLGPIICRSAAVRRDP
ncbi:MAG TPA: fimbria/pilus outer membrane usher protein, partial [Terriglobia bacterium]|nr:fimbria/pilus outer membrane usher protein [Terriglobia bacterium]